MRRIGIVPNIEKDESLAYTKEIVDWILAHDCVPCVSEDIAKALSMSHIATENVYDNIDFLVVLGGDGTLLRASRFAAFKKTPLLGINLGTLGYLTDTEPTHMFESLEKVINGNFALEKRMMLEADVLGKESLIALNDVCLTRSVHSTMITMQLSVNGEFIDNYKADGLIISTPTGSTAYNLSAGGSILKPNAEMIAITPICPHMIYSRPLVVSAEDEISIKLLTKTKEDSILTIDGQQHSTMFQGEEIKIRRSIHSTHIIKTSTHSFFEVLRHKMIGRI